LTTGDAITHTNDLLNYLSKPQREMIILRCKQITLDNGEVLNTVGMPIERVYFPITGFVSLKTEIIDDKNIEIGLIGSEGMLGASLALGSKNAPMTSTVRGSGSALSMDADLFDDLVIRYPQIRNLILNYLYILMQQIGQTSACNKFHMVKQRLAHWLLITQDRTHGNNLHLTHDFLAKMLGVGRSAITIAAGSMMQKGMISYSRGKIVVLSIEALELASCGCYRHAINAYNKTMTHLL
jgi:CRP-like cAMP-binding protein